MNENNTQNQDTNNQNDQKPKKNSKAIKIVITLIVLCVFVFLASFGYKLYNKSQTDFESPEYFYSYYDKSLFSIPEYNEISQNYRHCIIDVFSQNNYLDGEYFLTRVPNRAKKVFAFGNFSGKENQSEEDIAYLAEKNDFKSCRLFVQSSDCLLLYSKDYEYELPTINTFKKGQKVFLGDTKLEPSPSDGVMLQFKGRKTALLYIPESKTFEEYTQYSNEDLKSMENERNGEEEYAEGQEENEEENVEESESSKPVPVDSIVK